MEQLSTNQTVIPAKKSYYGIASAFFAILGFVMLFGTLVLLKYSPSANGLGILVVIPLAVGALIVALILSIISGIKSVKQKKSLSFATILGLAVIIVFVIFFLWLFGIEGFKLIGRLVGL